MKLLNELRQAQKDKDYKRVNGLRLAIEQEANTMETITIQGIPGTRLYHFQGGIGLPPSAIKVNGEWCMLDCNDSRIRKLHIIPPTTNKRGLASIIGRLYHKKHILPLITIDDLKELIGGV